MKDSAQSALANPAVRLGVGLVGFALAGAAVRGDHVGALERAVFRSVNQLPDAWRGPVWVVMQGGNIGAAPTTALIAAVCGRPALARRLLVGGSATWALAKLVKPYFRRPRPARLLDDARSRGRPQAGLGFASGHAAVAAELCAAALPELGPRGRRLAVAAATTVALSRLYVGAHLPLDVVGGAALGVVVEASLELWDPR